VIVLTGKNASWKQPQQGLTSGRRNRGIDGLVSVPRREKRLPMLARCSPGRGSNPLSTSSAGEDELNDDGFGGLAATHLAHHRNESGIRRSRFVVSPKHAPTLRRVLWGPHSSVRANSRGVENLITNRRR
jgi:hypothetical protein